METDGLVKRLYMWAEKAEQPLQVKRLVHITQQTSSKYKILLIGSVLNEFIVLITFLFSELRYWPLGSGDGA